MHLLSRFRSRASAVSLTLLLAGTPLGAAQSVPPPNLNLHSLGEVTVAGNFDAIAVYSSAGQQQAYTNNGTQSVLSQSPAGAFDTLAATDASIEAMCPLVLKNGTMSGLVLGGNFTSIGGVPARSFALFDPATGDVQPLAGIQGSVAALYCDTDTETVYVGGAFEAGNSTNAIAYRAGNWANLPFAGFDAPVTAITKAPNGHIVFGGAFAGLGNISSSALDDPETQVINLATANISAQGNSTVAGLGDPRNVVCPSNGSTAAASTFLLADQTPGAWRADLAFGFEPTKLRLWNTNQDGRGTKTWRFTAHPIDGIMNFTYTDPATGLEAHCDATCPLAHNASQPYQDFFFVNLVGMNSFTLDISDWYGAGGGLDGVELFQNDIFAYAIEAFNEPTCDTGDLRSAATATGPWYSTPSRQSVADYLTVVTGPTTVNSTAIVFQPSVPKSGNYSIIVYTPGCLQDSSCSARAIVNVTGTLTQDGNPSFSTLVYQTNNFDKYDQVYQGYVDATTDAFRPAVTLTPSGFQPDQLVVASRIRFGFVSSTGGLNGLFDYDPNSDFVGTDFSKSAINNAGTMLNPHAQVLALTTHADTLYAAGRFADDVFENIMAFENNNSTSLPGGGLDAAVTALYGLDDFLYAGGNFSNTHAGGATGLANVAAYQFSADAWVALGAGLNGPVDAIVPLQLNISQGQPESVVAFSGTFTQIQPADGTPAARAPGLAVWVPSRKAWLETLDVPKQALVGQLLAATFLPNGTWLGAGNLASLGMTISGAAALRPQSGGQVGLQPLPIDIDASPAGSPTSRKRAVDAPMSGVNSVAYYQPTGQNVTVFGGHFTATGTGGQTINNLMFLNASNANQVTGAPRGIDASSNILAMALTGSLLFAGGSITGQVANTNLDGLVIYDMGTADYRTVQPASLEGPAVVVNAIAPQPGSSGVYVGGAFDQTSQGLSCPCVCMYDTATNQWNTVGTELDGSVSALFWTSSTSLLATGNMTVQGNQTSLASYSTKDQTWTVMANGAAVPGPVSAFAPATDDAEQLWVAGTATNGSAFLVQIDQDETRPVVSAFGAGTTIEGLQIMPLSENHGSTPYLDGDQALLVTGQLNLPNFGTAAAALFNGTVMAPFILASTDDGRPGSVSRVFVSQSNYLKSSDHGHSRGIVVLVALCAALGTIFLIILLGIILNRIQRRRAGYKTVPSVPYADKHSNIHRVPPEALLGHLGSKQPAAPTL